MKTLSIICILTFWCFGASRKVTIDTGTAEPRGRIQRQQTPANRNFRLTLKEISDADAQGTIWLKIRDEIEAMPEEKRRAEIEAIRRWLEGVDHSPQSSPRSSSSRASSPRDASPRDWSPRSDAVSEVRSESSFIKDTPRGPHIDSAGLFADKEKLEHIIEQKQLIGDEGVFNSLCKLRTLVDDRADERKIGLALKGFAYECKECFKYEPFKLHMKISRLMNETYDLSEQLDQTQAYGNSEIPFIRDTIIIKLRELIEEISSLIAYIDFDNTLAEAHKESILKTFLRTKNKYRQDLDKYEAEFKKILDDSLTGAEKYKEEISRDLSSQKGTIAASIQEKIQAIEHFIHFVTELQNGESAILAESTSQGSNERGRSISRQSSDSGSQYYSDDSDSDSPRSLASVESSPKARFTRAQTA